MLEFKKPVGRIIVATLDEWVDQQQFEVNHTLEGVCEIFDLVLHQRKIYNTLDKYESTNHEHHKFVSFELYHQQPHFGHFSLLEGVASYLLASGSF